MDEHLDELELIVCASERGGFFAPGDEAKLGIADTLETLDYMLGWHDRHDRQLLDAARWALSRGWTREGVPTPNPVQRPIPPPSGQDPADG